MGVVNGGRYPYDEAAYRTPHKESKERRGSYPESTLPTPPKQSQAPHHHRGRPPRCNLESLPEADEKSVESASTSGNTGAEGEHDGSGDLMYTKPRKVFSSPEERIEFVRSYMSKQKTEVRAVIHFR